jgi:hypothetical protein
LALCTQLQQRLIAYHKSNGTTTMKKHVELEHSSLIKKFFEKQNNVVATPLSCEPTKKWAHVTPSAIFIFIFCKPIFKSE